MNMDIGLELPPLAGLSVCKLCTRAVEKSYTEPGILSLVINEHKSSLFSLYLIVWRNTQQLGKNP